jgi:hypothetical protein
MFDPSFLIVSDPQLAYFFQEQFLKTAELNEVLHTAFTASELFVQHARLIIQNVRYRDIIRSLLGDGELGFESRSPQRG